MTNCPNVNCRYRTYDDLCKDLKENCRIYIRYKAQHDLDKEYRDEQMRTIQENDIGLVSRTVWHEGKVV